MTKFLAFYNLCPIHDTKEFLGLSKDCEDGNIITTLDRNIIVIIQLSTQKIIRSWTVFNKLSTKVVYDQKSDQYVGLFGNRYIRCWDENTADINKLKELKFRKDVVDLISVDDHETVILYGDGTCESLSGGIQSRNIHPHPAQTEILSKQTIWDGKIFTASNGRMMLTYFVKDLGTQVVRLVTVTLDDNTLKPLADLKEFKLDRSEQNVNLAGHTVVDGQHNPFLLTIWSDKRIFVMPLREEVSVQDAPGNFISMLNMLNLDQPISILGISRNCVAIYGANSAQEGSSLLLYNTQFKVVNAKQFFKIYFNFSRLWVVGNHILLAMGQNLSVLLFRVSKELLSEMIGSQVSCNDVQPYVGKELINEDDELEAVLEFKRSNAASSRAFFEPTTYKNDVKKADGNYLPYQPYENFNDRFSRICNGNMHVNVFSSEQENDFRVDLLSNYNDAGFSTDEVEWLANDLEKCGASEVEITEKILTIVLKADLIADMMACIRRYSNISQKMLAKVLKYALKDLDIKQHIQAAKKEYTEPEEKHTEVSKANYPNVNLLLSGPAKITGAEKLDLLNLVLSCSIDNETMGAHIRKELDFNEILVLIEHLYNIIMRDYVTLEERAETSLEFDEDLHVLQWFSLILNTHFQELALSRKTKLIDILLNWKEVLLLYKKDLPDLKSISAILYSLIDGHSSGGNKHFQWYSIEEVKLF